jgi:hypothetical protein
MRSDEAKQIVLALDGLAAHIETIRGLVVSSIDAEPVIPVITKNGCQHVNIKELKTHGADTTMCEDCGFMGVLDDPNFSE